MVILLAPVEGILAAMLMLVDKAVFVGGVLWPASDEADVDMRGPSAHGSGADREPRRV